MSEWLEHLHGQSEAERMAPTTFSKRRLISINVPAICIRSKLYSGRFLSLQSVQMNKLCTELLHSQHPLQMTRFRPSMSKIQDELMSERTEYVAAMLSEVSKMVKPYPGRTIKTLAGVVKTGDFVYKSLVN